MVSLQIKQFHEEEKEEAFELFEKVFNRKITEEFWNWRFNNKEFGESIRYLMWEDQKLIGNYVVHPIPLKIHNDVEKVLFSLNVMTHPNHRGKGIFIKLAQVIYQRAIKSKYKLAIGFPNQSSYKIHFNKIGWINFGKLPEFYKNIESPIMNIQINKFEIKQINEFDTRIDKIWFLHKNDFKYLIPRTKDYLNWRFTNHPKYQFEGYPPTEYFCFIIEENDEPMAYFVLKKFGTDICHIVDYFGFLNKEIMEEMISFGIAFFKEKKMRRLSLWVPFSLKNKDTINVLEKFGFKQKFSEAYFGIRLFGDTLDKSVTDKKQWFITMSDSDVF